MTHITSDPAAFVTDATAGLCDLHRELVQPTPGGVIRAQLTRPGKVSLLLGGGSGHYPAFAGYVGPGLGDGAIIGNVFASPSARQAFDVARAASHGGGVVLAFGNYAGDVLNFGLAAERLRAAGIATELLIVTDDIASAPAHETDQRRGVAGDVVVFKIAGAAAEAGNPLDEVIRLGRCANRATRSFGVAFAGCTLPGDREPLFTVGEGAMGVGLGIHGEPGIEERERLSPDGLAALLVDRLLDEAPTNAGPRATALLNGLGATKYEELFGLWHHVSQRLLREGLELVAPQVGELVTSLDMAGCSLTLTWLNDELQELWLAPAQTPAFTRGPPIAGRPINVATATAATFDGWPASSPESRYDARKLHSVLSALANALDESEAELGQLDARAGDGDHGRGMVIGAHAAKTAAAAATVGGAGVASALAAAADAWADRSGGTSGVLWGVGLRAASTRLDDARPIDAAQATDAAEAALRAVVELGGARSGDKTLVDALSPLVGELESKLDAGSSCADAWAAAAATARDAADATTALTPRRGRARPLASRSVGHPDPGAVSLALAASVLAECLSSGFVPR